MLSLYSSSYCLSNKGDAHLNLSVVSEEFSKTTNDEEEFRFEHQSTRATDHLRIQRVRGYSLEQILEEMTPLEVKSDESVGSHTVTDS